MRDQLKIITDQVEQRVIQEAAALPHTLQSDPVENNQTGLSFIRQCFFANEVGDSVLYNEVHRQKFVYNVISGRWLVWIDPHWVIDYNGASVAAAEGVVEQYLRLVTDLDQQIGKADNKSESSKLIRRKTAILKRIDRLRTGRGRKSLLDCCASNNNPLTVHSSMLDQQPWLLPCRNGVIDLRTGVHRPGRPEDYLTIASDIEWRGIDEPCPQWMDFLDEILDGNQDVISYLHRVLGYSCTGLNQERIFLVLFGKHGQNGKGTLMEILYHVLGPLAGPIQTEMLMSQKFSKAASGPSPDIMALKGRRLAWASESEEGQSFAAGRLKLFSGGDPLVGRGLNDREQTIFMPSHTLFLLTNMLPHAPSHDNAFWERIKVINFPFSFLRREPTAKHERKADPYLLDNLKSESSGILAWLIRGCLEWQRLGLSPPAEVIAESQKYRRVEDDLQDFIEQCCRVDQDNEVLRVTARDLYAKYRSWWADQSSSRPMSAKKFGDIMSRKDFERTKSHGKMVYIGLEIVVSVTD